MLYCVNKDKAEKIAGAKTAGKKAPDDITELTCRIGGQRISFTQDNSAIKNQLLRKVRNVACSYMDWAKLYRKTKPGDVVVIQHPYEGIQAGLRYIPKMQKKDIRIICLIHDIRSLRDTIDEKNGELLKNKSNKGEIQLISLCDAVIAHNKSMKQYLTEVFQIQSEKIYELGIFDYLCLENIKDRSFDHSVVIAGNLSENKCKYLYSLLGAGDVTYPIHLYGPNYQGKSERVSYHGVVAPDELPVIIEGAFGLVWDGDDTDRCSGVAGEYLKYNNPHKCSLYLAAGIPVIIWKKAALASFVEQNGVGITVDSLLDLDEVFKSISNEKYMEYIECTKRVSAGIRSGNNYIEVMQRILSDMQIHF